MGLQDALDPDELGVARAAEGPVRVVHAPGYDCGVVDEDAADGDFGGGEGEFGLGEGLEHEGLVDCALGGGHLGGGGGGGLLLSTRALTKGTEGVSGVSGEYLQLPYG